MLPYQPNSDALLPPPALPPLRAEPVLSLPLSDDDSGFPLTIFALFFFSLLASFWSPIDFGVLDLGCVDDLVAFASTVLLGVDLGVGFGRGCGVAFGFGFALGCAFSIGFWFGISC